MLWPLRLCSPQVGTPGLGVERTRWDYRVFGSTCHSLWEGTLLELASEKLESVSIPPRESGTGPMLMLR